MAAGVYGGLHALPSWLLVHQALLRRPPATGGDPDGWLPIGAIVATLAALTAFVSLCTAAEAGLDGGVLAAVQQLLTEAMTIVAPTLEPAQRAQVVGTLAPLFVGFSAVSWQMMILINALIAQRVLAGRGRALRPSPRWSDMSLPQWLSWPLIASAIVGLAGSGDLGYLGRNLAIGLMVPYFLLGLSIVHRHSRRWPVRVPLLVFFYIALIAFTAVIGTALAGLGMISQWSGKTPASAQGRSRQE
jgi:hypothetical protein